MNALALVIEDDVDLSTVFAAALKSAGFEPEIIRDGAEAQARLLTAAPVLIALDLHLPGVPGTALLRQIKGDPHLADVYVILTTADSRLAEQYNDDCFVALTKPIGYAMLRDLAQRIKASMGNP